MNSTSFSTFRISQSKEFIFCYPKPGIGLRSVNCLLLGRAPPASLLPTGLCPPLSTPSERPLPRPWSPSPPISPATLSSPKLTVYTVSSISQGPPTFTFLHSKPSLREATSPVPQRREPTPSGPTDTTGQVFMPTARRFRRTLTTSGLLLRFSKTKNQAQKESGSRRLPACFSHTDRYMSLLKNKQVNNNSGSNAATRKSC